MNFWRNVAYRTANSKIFLILGMLYLAAYLYCFVNYILKANSYQFDMIFLSILFISITYKLLWKNSEGKIFRKMLDYNNDQEFQNEIAEFKKTYKLDFYILINILFILFFSIFIIVTLSFLYKLYWLENI